jgi:membrane-associated phospholipid phosphatase
VEIIRGESLLRARARLRFLMTKRRDRSSLAARLGAALLGAALLLPAQAAAQQEPPPNHPGYAFGKPGGEALLFLVAGLSNLASALPQSDTRWGPDAVSLHDRRIDRLSDVTGAYGGAVLGLVAGLGFEAGYFGEAGVQHGVNYAQRTALIELEGLLLTRAFVDATKRLTGRCRPHHFDAGKCAREAAPDAFPSGHTAPMGALAATRLLIAAQSTGPSGYRWGSFALAETMALTTALLRVRAGKHSWSDVAVGLLLGHAVGVLVTLAHPMIPVHPDDLRSAEGATGQGGLGLSWTGTF